MSSKKFVPIIKSEYFNYNCIHPSDLLSLNDTIVAYELYLKTLTQLKPKSGVVFEQKALTKQEVLF